ncbi:MAG: hypothetical protein ACYS5V_11770 [Planctomycetota bacterium]|jgi:hypothetical protein
MALEISREDGDNDGTADLFSAEVYVEVPGATQVRLHDGEDWVSLWGGDGIFCSFRSEGSATLADLLDQISGSYVMEITTPGNVSTYQYTVSGDAGAVAGLFPAPIPRITDVSWAGNTATLSWDWTGGDPDAVDALGVEVGHVIDGDWIDVYCKGSDEDPPNYIPKTTLHVDDIVFPAPPWTYEQIEFDVAYVNMAAVDGADGTVVSGWTRTGGDELFGGVDDEVLEMVFSEDYVCQFLRLLGDANLDGKVGIADLSALADHYGDTDASWMDGDFNDDGTVGIADLSALADNYGGTVGGVVPEPATLSLLAICSLALIRRTHRT